MAGRWYSTEGNLYGQIPTQKGSYRDFDLRDARKNGALPSVTTILGLLAKPGLVKWQVEQGIKAAWEVAAGGLLPINMTSDEAVKATYTKSQEYTRYTQEFGVATHWWVNKKLRAVETNEIPPMIAGSEEVADGVLTWLSEHSYDLALTEHRFARTDLGWAGTIDMLGTRVGVPCIIDLKTQQPPLTPYLEHALQLAGYDMALEPVWYPWQVEATSGNLGNYHTEVLDLQVPVSRERISLIANRLNPGEVKEHIWIDRDSTVEATNARYDAIWMSLVNLWMGINQYDPRVKQELEDDQATTLEYLLEELASD